MTPKTVKLLVPEVLEVHEVPSDEVRIIPPAPTVTISDGSLLIVKPLDVSY